ncbi:hypothetical protein KKI93_17115 [Xenorhabdus bovienii]|nr:hypothetical protein [Xenorhabdus bovienii]MDE9565735.1 hypothetical protein [Xenorhabdus bovienii]
MAKKIGKIKSALLNWMGVPIGLLDGAFWQEWNGMSSSGQTVSADRLTP